MVTNEQLLEMIEEMFLYDTGMASLSKGNEVMRHRLKETISGWPDEKQLLLLLSRYVRDEFLTEEALAKGYTIEDAAGFITWLRDYDLYL